MKSAIYSPYLDALGGGERYIMTIADYLGQKGSVDIFWRDPGIKQKTIDRFRLELHNCTVVPDLFQQKSNKVSRLFKLRQYDVFVFLSDGSFPFGTAKKNVLHMQIPFSLVNGKSVANRLKLLTWQHVVCNSQFTKRYIDETFGTKSEVLYPPVAIEAFHSGTKDSSIISVGRFHGKTHGKKQEVLIEGFKKLCNSGLKNWRLLLVGTIEDKKYYDELQALSHGYPVTFFGDIPFDELVKLYAQAKFFWHATGFGESDPKFQEHFGIATVEAMASGCIPIVYKSGGQVEIIDDQQNGFLWSTEEELLSTTKKLIANQAQADTIALAASSKSKHFSKEQFYKSLEKLLD